MTVKILALDTATEACSAALYIDGEITSRYQLAPREHSRLILRMLDELLSQANLTVAELDAIAFGRGPGSFMGLRIAAGVVQGTAFAHELPVIPVSTLESIAQRAYDETGISNVLSCIDARMDEVYWAACCYEADGWSYISEECVISPDKLDVQQIMSQRSGPWVAAGTGWSNYLDRLLPETGSRPETILDNCFPSAEAIAKLAAKAFRAGNTVPASQAIPVYLRNDVAKKPKPVVL